MVWPVGKRKTAEQREAARAAQLRRFGVVPDGLLRCSFCKCQLPDKRFARNAATPPNRRGRGYVCRICQAVYRRATTKTGKPRPIARVRLNEYRCARCKRVFSGDEFGWHVRTDRGNWRERDSYCRPCRRAKTVQWQAKPHGPETDAKLAATRKRSRQSQTRRARDARVMRSKWVVAETRRLLAQGWTLSHLGRELGVGRRVVAKWRDGKVGLGVYPESERRMGDLLLRIANGAVVPIDRRKRPAS